MAPGGSRPCCSLYQNLPPTDPVEDELARDPSPVGSPHSGDTSPAPSYNPTLNLIPALISALAATDDLFKKFMKVYLEMNQRPKQPLAERKQSLKAKVLEIYYGKLYMDCYHFC